MSAKVECLAHQHAINAASSVSQAAFRQCAAAEQRCWARCQPRCSLLILAAHCIAHCIAYCMLRGIPNPGCEEEAA